MDVLYFLLLVTSLKILIGSLCQTFQLCIHFFVFQYVLLVGCLESGISFLSGTLRKDTLLN